jgi:hypothetical protein
LTETAATLAVLTSKKQKERDQAWTRYYVLYFGPLRMFAGKAVFLAANEFAQCLEVPCPDKSTWDLATQIASSCRAELAENWNIKLPPLDEPNKGKK